MPDSTVDYYKVLGVTRNADQAAIRQAYHRAARQWHPDRVGADTSGVGQEGTDEAESEMRRINEAWGVLGDVDKRRAYDRRSTANVGGTGSRGGVVSEDGVVRIDPRLLDPSHMAARRHAQEADIAARRARVLGYAPLLALLVIVAGIVVFTAYVRNPQDASVGPTTTVPGPSLGEGIEANDCVTLLGGGSLLERPCDANALGRVIGARLPDGVCPTGTVNEVTLSNGAIVCLGVVG